MPDVKKATINVLPYAIVTVGFVFALLLIDSSQKTTRENNFYTRFQACVLTQSPSSRTPDTINSCYDQVQEQTGINADRYKAQGFKK